MEFEWISAMKYNIDHKIDCLPKLSVVTANNIAVDKKVCNYSLSPTLSAKAFTDEINLKFTYNDFSSSNMRQIGSGFFSDVYLVKHMSSGALMAFKVPRPTESMNRFINEIKLLKRLNHNSILRFHGTCIMDGMFGCLTEYLGSGSLSNLIEFQGSSLSWSLTVILAADLADGLVYLHEHSLVHRDLSAENILLRKCDPNPDEPCYRAVIADFGLCLDLNHDRNDRISTVGNPFYTAPENLTNQSPYNFSSDVFSFGLILCELITGHKNDPDQIPRTNNYGVDYKKLPVKLSCPKWLHDLACDCCMVHISYRPSIQKAHEKILENQQYIKLWQHQRPLNDFKAPYHDFFDGPRQLRTMSVANGNVESYFHENFHEPISPPIKIFPNNSFHRNMYRSNSMDSFLEPRILNIEKASKDLGYIDKPLTWSMKTLDPRIPRSSASDSASNKRTRPFSEMLFIPKS